MAIERDTDDAVTPAPTAGAPNLDAWRAEAGACAPLDAAATRGPWRECLAEQGGCQCCTIWSTPDDIPVADTKTAIAYEGKVAPESTMRADARFIAAARTGWPRDAARVGVLCERVAALEAALGEALDLVDSALSVATGVCAMSSECRERDRLRALLTDDFIRLDPAR